jgi:hypothetical protein
VGSVIPVVVFMVAGVALCVWGAIAMRRRNQHADRLRNLQPITPMRFRHLNVVDRCDMTLSCHARYHEPVCQRGRAIGDLYINRPLDEIDEEAD